jgi:hypothetical protein
VSLSPQKRTVLALADALDVDGASPRSRRGRIQRAISRDLSCLTIAPAGFAKKPATVPRAFFVPPRQRNEVE